MASVQYDIYFKGIDEEFSALESCYAIKVGDKWFLENSDITDPHELLQIQQILKSDDVKKMLDETTIKYNQAIAKHPEVKKFLPQNEG